MRQYVEKNHLNSHLEILFMSSSSFESGGPHSSRWPQRLHSGSWLQRPVAEEDSLTGQQNKKKTKQKKKKSVVEIENRIQ